MWFRPKTETIAWNDFFSVAESALTPKQKRQLNALLASASAVYVMKADVVLAAGIQERIIHAFDPLIQLAQGASYPVTFLMMVGGFLLIIIGKKQKGVSLIKWAAIGYLGIQFLPIIMNLLVEVGDAMKVK